MERYLFDILFKAKTRRDIQKFLHEIEKNYEIDWKPVGDRDNNYGTIHMTSSADVSLVERITNSIDATFERFVELNPALKEIKSPREFSETVYHFKDGKALNYSKKRKKNIIEEDGIEVRIHEGDSSNTPTIEILDNGSGIDNEEISKTILSLNQSNKIKKWYLLGRFGQGGSTTFQFSEYSIIFTKRHNATEMSFTLIKYENPKEDEKDGKYVYMVDKSNDRPFKIEDKSEFNTLVRHINYRLGKQSTLIDIYGKMNYFFFDPVLPFMITNHIQIPKETRRIFGSRDRLERTDLVETMDEIEIPANISEIGKLLLRYWVFKNQVNDSQKLTFIDTDNPILITYYGQTHAQLPIKILGELPFPYLKNFLVIQIDCDAISNSGRQKLFTSTRESITKEGERLIKKIILETLSNSSELIRINKSREESFHTRAYSKEMESIRKKLAEMISRFTLVQSNAKKKESDATKNPDLIDPLNEEDESQKTPDKIDVDSYQEEEFTYFEPNDFPTFIKIKNKVEPISLVHGHISRIIITSDAPNKFLSKNITANIYLSEECEDFVTVISKKSDFDHGKIYLNIRPNENIESRTSFELSISLSYQNNLHEKITISDHRLAIIDKPPENNVKSVLTEGPDIEPVDRTSKFFIDNNWNETSIAKVMKNTNNTTIYISLENRWLKNALKNTRYSPKHKNIIRDRYILLTAFNAYLQENLNQSQGYSIDELYIQKQLEIGVRTILTSLTSDKAYES